MSEGKKCGCGCGFVPSTAETRHESAVPATFEQYEPSCFRYDERTAIRDAVERMDRMTLCDLCDSLSALWLDHDWNEQEARAGPYPFSEEPFCELR